jgi:uncharacterized OsmC-like protein
LDSLQFLAVQEPFKNRYREDGAAALLTLKAKGALGDSNIVCKVETGRGVAVTGLHPNTGGTGLDLCSGDLLLEALIGCAGVAMKAAATVLDIPLKSAQVFAEGDVDLRGTLGISEDVPVGFKEIRLRFDVQSDAPKAKLDQLLELTERYCVVYHTLSKSPKVEVSMSTRKA